MKKIVTFISALMLGASVSAAEPLELGLLSPMQLKGPNTSVKGIRLGAVYTENRNIEGLDINLLANKKSNFKGLSLGSFYDRTEGDFTGVRIPWFAFLAFNSVGGNMKGVQLGTVNIVERNMTGVQIGAFNMSNSGYGFQLGGLNMNERFRGFQLGLVNYTKNLEGLQIGFVNIAENSEILPILPIVNFNMRF